MAETMMANSGLQPYCSPWRVRKRRGWMSFLIQSKVKTNLKTNGFFSFPLAPKVPFKPSPKAKSSKKFA
jgi:hypothetical protein